MPQEKPKAKERNYKNVKQVCDELGNIDELLQDVLNIHSSMSNGGTTDNKYSVTGMVNSILTNEAMRVITVDTIQCHMYYY